MKKIFSLVLVCTTLLAMVCIISFANAVQIGESSTTWELVDGVLTISGTGAMPDYRGVEDSRPWVADLATITKVVVKSGITHVGSSSFTKATALKEVVLEEGVETVGMDAFSNCGTIDKVSLPESLKNLGQGVFYNSKIKEISYPKTYAEFKANVTVGSYNTTIDAAAADWGEEFATSGTLTETMTWSFDNGVLTITGTGAMPNWGRYGTPWLPFNSLIKEVVISKGITTIGNNAFAYTAVSKIVVPEGVTTIGSDAFAYITTLKEIHIPSTLTTMGQGTVYGSNNITTVYYYGESKEAFEAISSVKNYNDNYTKESVTFIIAETDVEIQVLPYNNMGFENWSNQTQLYICPKLADGTKAAALYAKDVVWTITFTDINGVAKTVTLKQSSKYDAETWGIIRFQPCVENGGNQFIPLKNNSYTVEVSATVGNTTYHGVSAKNAYNMTVYPIVNGVVDESYEVAPVTDIELDVYPAFGGWENWVNSPNKGDAAAVTQLLVGAKSKDGTNISAMFTTDATWTITLTWADSGVVKTKTIQLKPGTTSAGNNLVRFETVLGTGDNQFIPYKNQAYTVSVSTEIDGVTYHGTSAEYAFSVPMYPIVNGVEDTDYEYVEIPDYFEAMVGKYYFATVAEAIAYAEAAAVEGKADIDNVNVVVIFKEGTYTVSTSTIVAVAGVDGVVVEYATDVLDFATWTIEVDGVSYTAHLVLAKDYAVAIVGDDIYTTIDSAIAVAEASTFNDISSNPVFILAEGEVVVKTNKMVLVVPYDDEVTTISCNTNEYFLIEYGTVGSFAPYAIINTETFAQAMVGETFYATVAEAIAAAEASTIDGVKNNPVIVLKSGTVAIDTAKAVAVVAYDENRTSLVFDPGKYFTYEVQVEYEGEARTAYAVLNTETFCQAMVGDTMYADLADAIAAAEGTFTPVIVFKSGNIYEIKVDSFVLIGVVDSEITVIDPAGNLAYETEVEYEGETYTAYALYNQDYIFANVADKITASIPQVTATYVNGSLDIALNTTDLTTLVGTEVFEEILSELAPLFVLSKNVSIDGVIVYENNQIIASNVFEAFNVLGIDLSTIAWAESKTISNFDIIIESLTESRIIPVSITLDITDEEFESLKSYAAKVDEYVDYIISNNGEIVLVVDARPVVDIVMEKEFANGKTIKEIREFLNSTSLKELADKLEGYNLTGSKAKAVKIFGKIVDKIANTKYAANLDSTLAMFDTDKDGVYVVDKSFTISFGEKINQIVAEFKANNPEIADYFTIENIVDVDSLTITVKATVTVFDTYTVTFVDADGNEIYSETLLEGEVPSYTGVAPDKATTDKYTYEFIGWTDGTTTFEGELAELTEDVTYYPVYDEIALNDLDENLTFEFGSVTFQDSFAINMVANKSVFEGYTSWWVVATLADGSEETLYGVENGSYYKFTLSSIAAKEVADVVSFTIYAEKEVNGEIVVAYGNAKEYCIKQYAMNKICCDNASDALKTLCVDTLVYAAQAQIKFNYNTYALATADLTADQLALGTQTAPTLENSFSYENTETELVHFQQATLVYESNIAIKFYLNLNEYAPEDVYVKVVYDDGAEELVVLGEELVENGLYYTFEFSEYSAAELRKEVVATVYDAATDAVISGPLTYGAEVYAYRQVAAGKDVDLVNAMMNYAISAEAVFNA